MEGSKVQKFSKLKMMFYYMTRYKKEQATKTKALQAITVLTSNVVVCFTAERSCGKRLQ